MPIYEFYCADCHTIFNFLARKPDTSKRPNCPRCGRPDLERRLSRFAVSKGRSEPTPGEELPADFDEAKMERVMQEMARQGEGLGEGEGEDDPRQMARMMRTLYDAAGMELGPGVQEAIRRMEAGEDPEKIEEEMGDVLDSEEPGVPAGSSAGGRGRLRQLARKLRAPQMDETLYELDS